MHVAVPFSYKAVGRLPRKRTDTTFDMRGSVDVIVREVAPDDAVPVMTYRHARDRHMASHWESCPLVELVMIDGLLYREALRGYDGDKGKADRSDILAMIDPDAGEALRENLRDVSIYPAYTERRYAWMEKPPLDGFVVASSDHDEIADRIRSRAEDFALVGDRLFKRGIEPVIEISRVREAMVVPVVEEKRIAEEAFHRADGAERLLEAWGRHGRDEAAVRRFMAAAPVVHAPQLLSYDEEGIVFRETAVRILEILSREIGMGDARVFAAYEAFRSAVPSMTEDLTRAPEIAAGLAEHALAVEDVVSRHHSKHSVRRFVELARGPLAERAADRDAVEGRVRIHGVPSVRSITVFVPLVEGVPAASIAEAAVSRASIASCEAVDGGLSIIVEAQTVEAATTRAEAVLDEISEELQNGPSPFGA